MRVVRLRIQKQTIKDDSHAKTSHNMNSISKQTNTKHVQLHDLLTLFQQLEL